MGGHRSTGQGDGQRAGDHGPGAAALYRAVGGDDGRDDAAVSRAGRGAVDPVDQRFFCGHGPHGADGDVPRRLLAHLGRDRGRRLRRPVRNRAAGHGGAHRGEMARRGHLHRRGRLPSDPVEGRVLAPVPVTGRRPGVLRRLQGPGPRPSGRRASRGDMCRVLLGPDGRAGRRRGDEPGGHGGAGGGRLHREALALWQAIRRGRRGCAGGDRCPGHLVPVAASRLARLRDARNAGDVISGYSGAPGRPARSVGTPARRPGNARASARAARTRRRSSCRSPRMPQAAAW